MARRAAALTWRRPATRAERAALRTGHGRERLAGRRCGSSGAHIRDRQRPGQERLEIRRPNEDIDPGHLSGVAQQNIDRPSAVQRRGPLHENVQDTPRVSSG